jgi:hypothetical protein
MRTFVVLLALPLCACVSTVKSVVTAPFKVAGQAADWATTSQDESDRNRGRAVRRAEERARKDCKRTVGGDYERENCVREAMRNQGF